VLTVPLDGCGREHCVSSSRCSTRWASCCCWANSASRRRRNSSS